MRPGNSASSTLNRSATIKGAWLASMTRADADVRRRRRDLPDHDFWRRTGDAREVMMFREPVARIAEAVGKPRQIERVA